ncbi:MAG TPA: glycogen synthase GlgA [Vicinamibacteria bacterium]|nr:glycogen synthase GlgA [Vicinamibacteria bacterium]
MPPLRVLWVASEAAGFLKTGGLGDVVGSLPKALENRGMDVRIVMPLYRGIQWDELERLEGVLPVPMYYGEGRAAVRLGRLPGSAVPVYFVEHRGYFDRPHLYGPPEDAYADNLERFTFLSRAALELAKVLGFVPDVVHAHDWQTALVPAYVNILGRGSPLEGAATVFTIHNMAHQGIFESGAYFITGLGPGHFQPDELEHFGELNLMKGGIQHCTMLSTVSPNYAREIQLPAYGFGLDGVLAHRHDSLRGILNGIDTDEWDPAKDPFLARSYDAKNLSGKAVCKAALQREMGLPVRADVPIFSVVARLTPQKGLDVLAQALPRILEWDVQWVLLGSGEAAAEQFFTEVARLQGDRFRVHIGFDNGLAHRIEAGADFFVMPSRFEPCGLNQLYSLRYGTLPVVRATGGLVDTVANYDERNGGGTGFVFHDLNSGSLADTIGWAASTFYDRPHHLKTMRQRAMLQDFSWNRSAADYEKLYLEAYLRRSGHARR